MKKILVIVMLSSAYQCAPVYAKSWLGEACHRILSAKNEQPTERLIEIKRQMESQIRHNNRFTHFPVKPAVEKLDFLRGEPMSVVLRPTLSQDMQWNYKPKLLAFVNPNSLDIDWTDQEHVLGETPALLALVENVEVRTGEGTHAFLADLMAAEAGFIHEKNKDLQFQLRSAPASSFKGLDFSATAADQLVFWVEGDLQNFQAKRILLVALEHAFENLARDPSYVRAHPK